MCNQSDGLVAMAWIDEAESVFNLIILKLSLKNMMKNCVNLYLLYFMYVLYTCRVI